MPAAATLASAVPITQHSLIFSRAKLSLTEQTAMPCDLERASSAEPLSPQAQSAQAQQPASPPQENKSHLSQQPSPVDRNERHERRSSHQKQLQPPDDKTDSAALVRAAAAAAVAAAAAAAATAAAMATPLVLAQSCATLSATTGAGSPPAEELPPPTSYQRVNLKGQGLGADDVKAANDEVRAAIDALSCLLDEQPMLEIRAAETETELLEALKLYRDMNHLSLTGVTCDQVIEHVLSHTVLLLYRPEPDEPQICVTAATFTMRQSTMMLRLLASHPRMTRKGFGRITVHFLKELCRALHKEDILVYTYPSSSPFYKAMHFRHTHPHGEQGAKPSVANADADAASREATRDARRAFSAKENEMIFHVQPSMAQVLKGCCHIASAGAGSVAHPYACTRRRASAGLRTEAATEAERAAAAPPPEARSRRGCKRGSFGGGKVSVAAAAPAGGGDSGGGSGSGSADMTQSELWVSSVTPLFTATSMGSTDDTGARSRSKRVRLKSKDVYQVEEILDVQRNSADASDVKYLIKWKGWSVKYNTWEPLRHLQNLSQEIEAFEASRRTA